MNFELLTISAFRLAFVKFSIQIGYYYFFIWKLKEHRNIVSYLLTVSIFCFSLSTADVFTPTDHNTLSHKTDTVVNVCCKQTFKQALAYYHQTFNSQKRSSIHDELCYGWT